MPISTELQSRLSSSREIDRHQALRELARRCPYEESRPVIKAMRRDPSRLVRFQARSIMQANKHRDSTGAWLPTGSKDLLWLAFSLDGRITRCTYWMAGLLLILTTWVFNWTCLWLCAGTHPGFGLLFMLNVPFIWAALAIRVKRWHDLDMSGWWVLAYLVPVAGALWSFVQLGFARGTQGPNQYGERGI